MEKDNKGFSAAEYTRRYKARIALKKKEEQEYWESLNGPVTITYKVSS